MKIYFYFSLLFFSSVLRAENIQELSVSQPIDHHDLSKGHYNQRYFEDRTFAKTENAPVILFLCGEQDCFAIDSTSILYPLAKETGATIVSLEHRFYGKSQPFPDHSVKSLKYLSVDQAILDIVSFQKNYDPNLQSKWIVVGSSYAGTLAAIFRSQYPSLSVGAYASSAPLEAKLSFTDYDEFSAKALGPKCAESVQKLNEYLSTLSSTDLETIRKQFKVPYVNGDDNLLFLIPEFITAFVQYGYGDMFCGQLSTGNELHTLLTIANLVNLFYNNGNGYDLSTWGFGHIDTPEIIEGSISRQWWYQVCTEMGFFQVASPDRKNSIRPELLSASFFQNMCQRVYRIDHTDVDGFNKKYYDPISNGDYSNLIFVNGTDDPWSELSILPNSSVKKGKTSLVLLNVGGAHSTEMYFQEGESLSELQHKIIDQLKTWLE